MEIHQNKSSKRSISLLVIFANILSLSSLFSAPVMGKSPVGEGLNLDWEEAALIEHDDGTKTSVLSSSVEGTGLLAFKGLRFFKYTPEQLLWVIMDMKQREQWVELFDQVSLVGDQPKPPFHARIHQKLLSPFAMLTPRDFVIEVKAYRLKGDDARKIYIAAKSVQHPQAPLHNDFVRMNMAFSLWSISPASIRAADGKEIKGSNVSLEVLTDPMGSIPNFVVNFVQKKYPVNLFNRMIGYMNSISPGNAELPPFEEAGYKFVTMQNAEKK